MPCGMHDSRNYKRYKIVMFLSEIRKTLLVFVVICIADLFSRMPFIIG